MASGGTAGGSVTDSDPTAGASVQPYATSEQCGDGKGCFWHRPGFEGAKEYTSASEGLFLNYTFRSVKNRFYDRKLRVFNRDEQTGCLDPGENRSSIAESFRYDVGPRDSRCG